MIDLEEYKHDLEKISRGLTTQLEIRVWRNGYALCDEVQTLRKEIKTYRFQEYQEDKFIAKIERLEGKNETLRELVGVQKEFILLLQHEVKSLVWKGTGDPRHWTEKETKLRTKIERLEGKIG